MERREALKRIGVLMGGAVSLSTASGILGGCKVGPRSEPFVPKTLTAEQNELVTTISELIIPETDTGGAKAARVNEFIDKMLTDWVEDDDKQRFLSGLDQLESSTIASEGSGFLELAETDQIRILESLEAKRAQWREAVGEGTASREERPFFEMMRELTIAGYYTSEIGASQELKYEIIFTSYEGDVPYEEIGRAWS
ncbi:MAG: gluconate 2-dehydrogenase subunit 3 family protein [Rhodothermia bacterium]|nr:gluconate 2-dehydrogenase subunit 3 family protein [Rhodothermia bacterium]